MSNIDPGVTGRRRLSRPSIKLPDGDFLQPRVEFSDEIGASEKTVTRMNLPTTYVAGVAYIKRNASLEIIADSVKRRNQGAPRRRRK